MCNELGVQRVLLGDRAVHLAAENALLRAQLEEMTRKYEEAKRALLRE